MSVEGSAQFHGITLPVFVARMIERTRPAFYVHRLAKTKRGWRLFQDAVVTLATQAADKRDWDGLAMMVALLGQLREPDPRHNLERGWGYQYGLPRVIRHLVETDNDRGLREVLGTIAHGACVTRTTWILELDETRGRFENWLRLRWLMRPAWAHRIEARLKGGQPLLVIPRSYDYGILMGLTSCMNTITHVDDTKPGEPYLPKRVAGFSEWAKLLTTVIYSTYLLDESAKEDGSIDNAQSGLSQMSAWIGLLGTVNVKLLRNVVLNTPSFPGGFGPQFPLHLPVELQEREKAAIARLSPAKTRAANRLAQDAIKMQSVTHASATTAMFWPKWEMLEGRPVATGYRPSA